MKKWFFLFLSNFLGVFNDNFLKNAIIFIAVGWKLPYWLTQSQLIAIVSASLVIPYLILSPLGGRLTIRFAKLTIFRFFKLIELPIMILASLSFIFEWVIPAIISVLLMGIQSCLYSPAKYGLIQDIGGKEGSAFGSGIFEAMAFLGILAGTVIASVVSDSGNTAILISLFLLVAASGYWTTIKIKANEIPVDVQDVKVLNLTPWTFLIQSYRFASTFPGLIRAITGVSMFWLIGAMLQMNIIIHATGYYHASNTETGIVMAFAAIGIGFGTWISGLLSAKFSSARIITGGISLMLFSILMIVFFKYNLVFFSTFIFLAAFGGGFFQVPNLSIIQKNDSGRNHGQILAFMNLCIFIFVLIGTLLFSVTTYLTDENSIAVFALISVIAGIVLFYYFVKRKS